MGRKAILADDASDESARLIEVFWAIFIYKLLSLHLRVSNNVFQKNVLLL